MRSLILLVSILLMNFAVPQIKSFSQELPDSTALWSVETKDGNTFIGSIKEENTKELIIHSEIYGRIHIPISQIKFKRELNQANLVEGELWFDNPYATRYFFMTNGYGQRKGEGYYQNTWVLFNQVSYGITNNISLGGGLVPLFLFAGAPTPVFLTPKVTLPVVKDKFNIGAGAIMGYLLGEDMGFGIGYGAMTLGSRDKNLTLGAGWAYADSEWANAPTFTLSGMIRVSKKTYLLTEDYYIGISQDSSIGILSFGGRSVQKRLAIDYGLFLPIGGDIGSFIAIPWLGVAVPFGNPLQSS
jgi:hypothetical protein